MYSFHRTLCLFSHNLSPSLDWGDRARNDPIFLFLLKMSTFSLSP